MNVSTALNEFGNLKYESKSLTVLLVDDNESTNFFNKVAINRCTKDVNINIATNGKQALELIYCLEATGVYPDVIFLDINMPCLNGIEFLEQFMVSKSIKNNPKIVFTLSTELSSVHIEKLNELGVAYETCEKMLKKSTLNRYLDVCIEVV